MRSFSIVPNSDVSYVDQYTDFLTNEVYHSTDFYLEEDINDPLFLQKVGLLRAQGIHQAIKTNGAVLYEGFQCTNDNIKKAAAFTAGQMHIVADKLTTSLDNGFTALGYGLSTVNQNLTAVNQNLTTANQTLNNIKHGISQVNIGVAQTNKSIQQLGAATVQGFLVLHNDIMQLNSGVGQMLKAQNVTNLSLKAMSSMIGVGFSMIKTCFFELNNHLDAILTELKIPETQRERRYHIEQGAKYLRMAFMRNDKYYFEDALDEFNKAIAIERKDYFSWYNIGVLYLRSPYSLDVLKAIDAFERYLHYAEAEFQFSNNLVLKSQLDEVRLLMAEAQYIINRIDIAVEYTTQCDEKNTKAKLMRVKYLSATRDNNFQEKAAAILKQLLQENPLLSLEILDDADILNNKSIIIVLEQLRIEAVNEAKRQYQEYKLLIAKSPYFASKQVIINSKIDSLIQSCKYLDAYEAICLIAENKPIIKNGHIAIDLGLPSGTLWATCNIGATNPEGYGDYFAWGEVEPKEYYNWRNEGEYKWGTHHDWSDTENYGMTKYNKTDGKTVLDPEDDAAHVNWGGAWRMPTKAEQDELRTECTWTWTTLNGVNGYKVTSKANGNYIFLPAAGYRYGSSLYGDGAYGNFWGSSLNAGSPYFACYVYFYSDNYDCYFYNRYYGHSFRAVCSSR